MNAHDMYAIAALDLEPIKVKLMHEESGEGWSLERANAVEFEYRRFLFLMKKFPNEQTAPLVDVDTFWHYHILDTMKYAADCDAVFGHFLHHFPYIGLRGEDDEAAHIRVGERMKELYEATFGVDYVRAAPTAHSGAIGEAAFAHSGAVGPIGDAGADVVDASAYAHSGAVGPIGVTQSGKLAAGAYAHSGAVGPIGAAYSGAIGTAAYAHSGAIGASAYAHSGAVGPIGIAHSGAIGASRSVAEAAIVAAQQSSFYTQRPRLLQAA